MSVPTFGFGAELPSGELCHCFALRDDAKVESARARRRARAPTTTTNRARCVLCVQPCVGVNGVLEAYRSALRRVTLSGPTVFR